VIVVCDTCGSSQGPFDRRSIPGKRFCKNTIKDSNRLSECLKRRDKIDATEGATNLREVTIDS